jgi:GIY-YIG catalytic domain/NUMOD3 motif
LTGIYTIENLINGKIYIGYATDIVDRWSDHRLKLRKNVHGNPHLQSAWNKHTESNFKFEILEECEEQFLYSQEHYWATTLNTHNRLCGYNERPTHPYGKVRMSEESKKRVSISQMGRISPRKGVKLTQKTIDKRSATRLLNDPEGKGYQGGKKNKGRSVIDEFREKMRQLSTGRIYSEESKKKISDALMGKNKGRVFSEEHRRKISEGLKGKLKGPMSEEHRLNISKAKKKIL